jgi:C-terminal peptidase prc
MIKPFLDEKRGFCGNPPRRVLPAAFAAAFCLIGCISDPAQIVLPNPTEESLAVDEITYAAADRSVDLFEPRLDPTLPADGQSILTQAFPVRVREPDSNRVVEYNYSRRFYGSWNAQREYEFNLLLLRSFFLRPSGLFQDTTGASTTAALFARAAVHDRFTRYIDSAAAVEFERNLLTTEEPKVLGFLVHQNDAGDSVILTLVAPASPAHRAGLRRGMVILAVNDSVITGDSAATRFLRFFASDTTGPVKLTVWNPTTRATFSREMTREKVRFPSVLADRIGSVGYIAIYSFTESTVDEGSTYTEFKAALKATRSYPTTVIDLRGNGGGSLRVTLQMCEEVLSAGVLFKVVERRLENGASVRYEVSYRAHAGESGERRKFVLLADSSSASASELFITALREGLQAPLVGTHTYGKGVGQAAFNTPGKGYSVITYGRVLTAAGVDYNGTGLTPTHPSTAKPDAMLAEAAQVASAPLAKTGATQPAQALPGQLGLLEWNRREGRRPAVIDLVFPGVLNER